MSGRPPNARHPMPGIHGNHTPPCLLRLLISAVGAPASAYRARRLLDPWEPHPAVPATTPHQCRRRTSLGVPSQATAGSRSADLHQLGHRWSWCQSSGSAPGQLFPGQRRSIGGSSPARAPVVMVSVVGIRAWPALPRSTAIDSRRAGCWASAMVHGSWRWTIRYPRDDDDGRCHLGELGVGRRRWFMGAGGGRFAIHATMTTVAAISSQV